MSDLMQKYGQWTPAAAPAETLASPLHTNAPAQGVQGIARGLSPQSPTFWLLTLAAATMGLAGVSTSGHLGPIRASLKAGK